MITFSARTSVFPVGPGTVTVTSHSENETISLGRQFAATLKPGDVVALFGDIGSGKTTFVRGIVAGRNSADEVSSPTFTLINEYRGKPDIYHFDFYRIAGDAAAEELGCEEYFGGSGICLIEWPERIPDLLPAKRVDVHLKNFVLSGNRNEREITIYRK